MISKELQKIEDLKKTLERDNSLIEEQEKEIINNAKIKAREILLDAKEDASEIISKMQKEVDSSGLNNLRNRLNDEIKELSVKNFKKEKASKNPIDIKEIKPNTEVYITTLDQNGTIISNVSKSNEVQVRVGAIKMNINIKYLEKAKKINKVESTISYKSNFKTKNVNSEINVIGLNVDEAIPIVDKFLDDCYLAKLETVRIIHGKGTGKLRDGIHQFLKVNPHVVVTVVKLKK